MGFLLMQTLLPIKKRRMDIRHVHVCTSVWMYNKHTNDVLSIKVLIIFNNAKMPNVMFLSYTIFFRKSLHGRIFRNEHFIIMKIFNSTYGKQIITFKTKLWMTEIIKTFISFICVNTSITEKIVSRKIFLNILSHSTILPIRNRAFGEI